MNPFDLRGPEFLLFYAICTIVGVAALYFYPRLARTAGEKNPKIEDPYLIACLRGGQAEAVRVAALALLDRGLLRIKSSAGSPSFSMHGENQLELSDPAAVDIVKRPIEKQVLAAFEKPAPISETLDSLEYCGACGQYAKTLERHGLIFIDDSLESMERWRWMVGGTLGALAIVKVFVALSRGRTNVLFLMLLSIGAVFAVMKIAKPLRTQRGEKLLLEVRSLFSGLRARAAMLRPGGANSDLVWLASAYGLGEVPTITFPLVTALMNRGGPQSFFNYGGGWGNRNRGGSSGSTTSSCSSGCGGGGCGGGCGGACGGCGS